MDRGKMCNLKRGPSIDASYQVSVHLAEGFKRRRLKCEKLTEDRRRTPSDGKSSHCLWQGELKNHADKNYYQINKYNSKNSACLEINFIKICAEIALKFFFFLKCGFI
jgi:hypothetical protein